MINLLNSPKHLTPILFSFLLYSGCSSSHKLCSGYSSSHQLNEDAYPAYSQTHTYNKEYGLIQDPKTDAIIHQEIISQNQPTEIIVQLDDPNYTTELERDPEAFLAEEWVEPEPQITYKYDDDPRFYKENELPENKLRLGNVIVKVPEGADQSTILEGIERASTPQSGY
jgi:hypothetical protein